MPYARKTTMLAATVSALIVVAYRPQYTTLLALSVITLALSTLNKVKFGIQVTTMLSLSIASFFNQTGDAIYDMIITAATWFVTLDTALYRSAVKKVKSGK